MLVTFNSIEKTDTKQLHSTKSLFVNKYPSNSKVLFPRVT